jgi:DNA-binding GntR family transcriptional regulator
MRIADAIRRDIVYGHLPPGARIPQHEYAARYHVGPSSNSGATHLGLWDD